ASQARQLDATDPPAANLLWQQVDQKLTDASPDILITRSKADALISARLGNLHTHFDRRSNVRSNVGSSNLSMSPSQLIGAPRRLISCVYRGVHLRTRSLLSVWQRCQRDAAFALSLSSRHTRRIKRMPVASVMLLFTSMSSRASPEARYIG